VVLGGRGSAEALPAEARSKIEEQSEESRARDKASLLG